MNSERDNGPHRGPDLGLPRVVAPGRSQGLCPELLGEVLGGQRLLLGVCGARRALRPLECMRPSGRWSRPLLPQQQMSVRRLLFCRRHPTNTTHTHSPVFKKLYLFTFLERGRVREGKG